MHSPGVIDASPTIAKFARRANHDHSGRESPPLKIRAFSRRTAIARPSMHKGKSFRRTKSPWQEWSIQNEMGWGKDVSCRALKQATPFVYH